MGDIKKLDLGKLMTEYKDGYLTVEYFGAPSAEVDSAVVAAAGRRPTKGGQTAVVGSEGEHRTFWMFAVSAEEAAEIRRRLSEK